jgi:hypothetical protein
MSMCLPLSQQKTGAAETTENGTASQRDVCVDYCIARLVFDLIEDCSG